MKLSKKCQKAQTKFILKILLLIFTISTLLFPQYLSESQRDSLEAQLRRQAGNKTIILEFYAPSEYTSYAYGRYIGVWIARNTGYELSYSADGVGNYRVTLYKPSQEEIAERERKRKIRQEQEKIANIKETIIDIIKYNGSKASLEKYYTYFQKRGFTINDVIFDIFENGDKMFYDFFLSKGESVDYKKLIFSPFNKYINKKGQEWIVPLLFTNSIKESELCDNIAFLTRFMNDNTVFESTINALIEFYFNINFSDNEHFDFITKIYGVDGHGWAPYLWGVRRSGIQRHFGVNSNEALLISKRLKILIDKNIVNLEVKDKYNYRAIDYLDLFEFNFEGIYDKLKKADIKFKGLHIFSFPYEYLYYDLSKLQIYDEETNKLLEEAQNSVNIKIGPVINGFAKAISIYQKIISDLKSKNKDVSVLEKNLKIICHNMIVITDRREGLKYLKDVGLIEYVIKIFPDDTDFLTIKTIVQDGLDAGYSN